MGHQGSVGNEGRNKKDVQMSQSRLRKRFLDCSKMTLEEAESFGHALAEQQRDVMWHLADLARYAESRWPDNHFQIWPEWISPDMIARCKAVGAAYPREEDRKTDTTYTIYMRESNHPDRVARVQAHHEAGRTSDEAREADRKERQEDSKPRWLLAVDVNYHVHRMWHSGAGVESAMTVSGWVERIVERLRAKGLTDVACCFDDVTNHRKALTAGPEWEGNRYKDRPPKDPELVQQIQLVRELLEGKGFCCVSMEGMEADDIMASLAVQFDGRTTLFTMDKDLRQSLSSTTNMLLDIDWEEDEISGDKKPVYKWLSAKQHEEETGLTPEQTLAAQTLSGDNVDSIRGAEGIGVKGAADLIQEFGTVENAIQAAKDEDERIKPKKRESLLEFEPRLEITRQLVTLKTDLGPLPSNTKI